MFNSLRGILTEKRPDSLCLQTGGIEWELFVPTRSIDEFGSIGLEARAFIWLHHYEDGMRLFGFPTREERIVFLELMKVEGIGPKQALRVLSGISPSALDVALESEDLAALQMVPGVGPKLAQKMLLALKGKLVLTSEKPIEGRKPSSSWGDVIKALADMGFDRREAERVVEEKAAKLGATSGEARRSGGIAGGVEKEIFRLALLELSTGA